MSKRRGLLMDWFQDLSKPITRCGRRRKAFSAVVAEALEPRRLLNAVDVLASLNNGDQGGVPETGLLMDGKGDLFGTTTGGGADGYGTIFEIPKGSTTTTVLASLPSVSAATLLDSSGDL